MKTFLITYSVGDDPTRLNVEFEDFATATLFWETIVYLKEYIVYTLRPINFVGIPQ